MDAEQAWQSALGQLQMEMPKASFDTWVRDTRIVSYDDGKLSIGVRNAYARDWLESRLSSTVTRLLMGIMNRSVGVEFVVAEAESESSEDDDPEPEADDQTEALPEEGDALEEDDLLVEAHYDLVYDEIVNPDRVVVLPDYFRKHLRLIGPDLGWLYLAFRQAGYSAGGRSGIKRERFSGQTIAGWCGVAVSTFWNRIGKDDTWTQLRGLVSTSISTPEWDTTSATPKRLPRKYVVSMTLPLTAADARSLSAWLLSSAEGMGGPEQALAAAAETPLAELLPADAPAGESPESVTSIVRSLFANVLPAERLATLSTHLHKHIMPDKDLLVVTHFFLQNVLPHLGAGPGWMLTLLRDRCWVNQETGETRNQVTVQGGYAEIVGWLGLSRPKTVWDWLYGKHSQSRKLCKPSAKDKKGKQRGPGRPPSEIGKLTNPVLRVYLREVSEDKKVLNFSSSSRTFEVFSNEIPDEILEAVLSENPNTHPISRLVLGESLSEADLGAVCSIGMARFVEDLGAVCSIKMARFVEDLGAVCRVFKSLNLLNPSLNSISPSPLPPSDNLTPHRITNSTPGRGAGESGFLGIQFPDEE